jgi:hypothetical protein
MRSKWVASIAFVALAAAATSAGAQTLEEQLRDLKRLRDAGLLSEPVYAEQQRRILEGGAPKAGAARTGVEPKTASVPTTRIAAGLKVPPVGATLTYRLQDKLFARRQQAFTVKIDGANGSHVNELIQMEKGERLVAPVDAQSVRFVDRDLGGGIRFVELSPYLLNAATPTGLPNPPTDYPLGGSIEPFKVRVTNIVEDQISVPAGTFKTVRIDVSGERSATGFSGLAGGQWNVLGVTRFRYTAWYSADLNRYVMVRHQQWNPSGSPVGDEVVQLVSYDTK